MSDNNVSQVGTGQQGAGSLGGDWEKNSHAAPQTTEQKIDEIANEAAVKGMNRQRREDPSIFTK